MGAVSTTFLDVPGIEAPSAVRRRASAKRVTLSVSRATGAVGMTLPPRFRMDDARRFVEAHRGWLEERLDAAPRPVPFTFGMRLPFEGRERFVVRGPARRVELGKGTIRVGGDASALPGMLERWLRREARERLVARVDAHCETIGARYRRLAIRDTRTRWGSCSAKGTLSFSWRVVMAPPGALDYLAAHEVAHLREMNHGPRFWALCERLAPETDRWRAWFKAEGPRLHRYGHAFEGLPEA